MSAPYFLAEVSFEAGNKVGGIWAVLTSKSSYIQSSLGDNYLAVGFYNPEQAAIEFMETPAPQFIKDTVAEMKLDGVKIYFGKWVQANNVNIILVDAKEFENKHVNEVKKQFWDSFKIDSLNSPGDYNEPLAWSYAVGEFLSALGKHTIVPLVVQAHEWLSAGAILNLKAKKSSIPTVFTIHATVLGRAFSYSGGDTLSFIKANLSIDKKMPYDYGVAAKHFTECAGAMNATIFTVVSDIVSKEAQVFLGKKPDLVTINGIDLINLPDPEGVNQLSEGANTKFTSFLNSYFLPYYDMKTKNIPVFITSGRYEFYDKGFDLFIDALGKLDKMLADDNYVIALIAVPSGTMGLKNEVVANYLTYLSIKQALDADLKNFDNLVVSEITDQTQNLDRAYSKILNDSRRFLSQLRRPKPINPPLCPFMLSYPENNDNIINRLKANGLDNSDRNHVKVVFYPKYLSVGDELLNLTYNEMLAMSTAGFFLSKYEPFGYTPLEAASYMSMAFTTDHSGFGVYCSSTMKTELRGVFVENLSGKSRDEVVSSIATDMFKIALMNPEDVLRMKLSARRVAENFGWDKFLPIYLKAYESALKRN